MVSKKMEKALNKQINAEMYSAYLYAAMGAYFDAQNLDGFATWMRAQAQEEMEHAMKFYAYIVETGGRVIFEAIDKPPAEFGKPEKVFEEVLKHERKVTRLINALVELARSEKDYATDNFLQWFVAEQVEEEATADGVLQKLKMIAGHPNGLFMMNAKLGERKEP
ncbi:MAG TPA: ferritin [Candidatus Hydrogenedentes bacterium]|jgi:ferritin|nr:ferritin [Candidatus Hydrogenedentota bacterium]HPJ99299.1 ferritin [Candidatus Hydrogenedentota bacterium]